MPKTISHKVVYKKTTPKCLYDLYMNAKKHSMIAGGPVKISAKEGANFSAHGDYITGSNLKLIKDKLILQTWRAQNWDKADGDSIFMIMLEPKGKDVVMHAVHTNIPDAHAASINKGWHEHYWNPWKQFLAGKPITRPKM
jgi:activator of HSP90 ATPase